MTAAWATTTTTESGFLWIQPQNSSPVAPPGYTSYFKLTNEECDRRLARIFGAPGAVVGSTVDPGTLGRFVGFDRPNGVERARGHGPEPFDNPDPKSSDRGGIIHVYGNPQGTASNTALYAPSGGALGRMGVDSLKNTFVRVSYGTGLTITFVHVSAGTGDPNAMGSVRIGDLGGPGGNLEGYVHSHLIFYSDFKKGIRVDPRKVFCGQ